MPTSAAAAAAPAPAPASAAPSSVTSYFPQGYNPTGMQSQTSNPELPITAGYNPMGLGNPSSNPSLGTGIASLPQAQPPMFTYQPPPAPTQNPTRPYTPTGGGQEQQNFSAAYYNTNNVPTVAQNYAAQAAMAPFSPAWLAYWQGVSGGNTAPPAQPAGFATASPGAQQGMELTNLASQFSKGYAGGGLVSLLSIPRR